MNVEGWRAALAGALQANAAAAEMVGPGRWSVRLHGAEYGIVVEHVDGWLSFEASAAGADASGVRSADLAALLSANATLAGNLKHTLCGPGLRRAWRAEMPLVEELPLDVRIKATLGAFVRPDMSSAGGADMPSAVGFDGIEQACVESGWTVSGRDGETLRIPLETASNYVQATARRRGSGFTLAVVLVPAPDGDAAADALCAQARALLLLRVAAIVRWARPAAWADGTLGFEVNLDSQPLMEEVAHALGALSVAHRLCGAEAQVLSRDARIAHEYLRQTASQVSAVQPCGRGRGG